MPDALPYQFDPVFDCPNCKQRNGAHVPHCRLAPPAEGRLLPSGNLPCRIEPILPRGDGSELAERNARYGDGFRAGYRSANEVAAALAEQLLEPITRYGCTTFVGPATCRTSDGERMKGAQYGADAWCAACVALDLLDTLNTAAGRTPAPRG